MEVNDINILQSLTNKIEDYDYESENLIDLKNKINLTNSEKINISNDSQNLEIYSSLEYESISKDDLGKEWFSISIRAAKELDINNNNNNNKNKDYQCGTDFIFVVDRSGSMKSENKMAFLQGTMEYFINNLDSKHRIAIELFNADVEIITEIKDGNEDEDIGFVRLHDCNKELLLKKLKTITPEGSTNISLAIYKAIDIISKRKIKNQLTTILFFTDGHNNTGEGGRNLLNSISSLNLPRNLSIHTFGFGVDHDSFLLQKISFCTKSGVYYYIETSEMIPNIFAECLEICLSTIACDIQLSLEAQKGCRIINFWTKFPVEKKEPVKNFSFHLGSLSRLESRTILFRLSLNKCDLEKQVLILAKVKYLDPLSNSDKYFEFKIETTRKTTDLNYSNNSKEEELTLPLHKGMHIHFFRYLLAFTIDEIIQNLVFERTDAQFKESREKLIQLMCKINEEKSFATSRIGCDYLSILQEMNIGLQNPQIFEHAIHYSQSYLTMLYIERSSGIDSLSGLNQISKQLNLIPTFLSEKRKIERMTESLLEHRNHAKSEVNRYIENYF